MSKLCFHISMSLDGYVAGRNQGPDDPLGKGGLDLHDWFASTRMFKTMFGEPGEGETGLDNDRAEAWIEDFGATIMGRNMFGPIRGDWGRCGLEGLVGRQPALSQPGVRPDPSRPRPDRDEGRDHVPLRDRRARGGARSGP
jgi:dihydrofolate reductase